MSGSSMTPRTMFTPANLSSMREAKRLETSPWPASRMLTANAFAPAMASWVFTFFSMQTRTRGGWRESDAKEATVMPYIFPSCSVVTTVTPLAKCDMASLNCASSIMAGRSLSQTFRVPRRTCWAGGAHPMRRLSTAAAALVVMLAASAQAAQNVHRTFNIAPGGKLVLTADVGDVRITSGGSGVTVDMQAEGSASALDEHHVDFRQEGNTLYVDGDYDHSNSWSWLSSNRISVRYTIQVPARFDVDVKTSGGDLDIAGLAGEIDARTSGGNVEVGRMTGNVRLKTSGGDVVVHGVSGNLTAVSSGGGIEVEDAGG